MGVNLLVEGAPIRRSRPPHRQIVISHPALTLPLSSDQSSPEEGETKHKSSDQESRDVSFCRSGKENRAVAEKKRQPASSTPKRQHGGEREVQKSAYVRRSCRSLVSEQPVPLHTEPQRKAQRLGLGVSGATLVPWSLSFSLNRSHSMAHCKCQPSPGHESHMTRASPAQISFERHQRTSAPIFPSLKGPLPTLEVFSLRPNVVARTAVVHNRHLSSHSGIHSHPLVVCSRRRSMAKLKAESREEHKPQQCQRLNVSKQS